MITAKEALEAYSGRLPAEKYIPQHLQDQIDNTIRLACLAKQSQCVTVLEDQNVGAGIRSWLIGLGYNVVMQQAGPDHVQLLISWSSILLP